MSAKEQRIKGSNGGEKRQEKKKRKKKAYFANS